MLGSTARVLHALLVWLAFFAIVHFSRVVLFPAFGVYGGVIAFIMFYGGVVGLLLVRGGRLRARDLGYTRENFGQEVILGLAGFVIISVLLLGWIQLSGGSEAIDEVIDSIAGFTVFDRMQFLVIGLLAASAEETVFRGYLQPALMARYTPAIGIVVTAALFAAGHFTDWPTIARLGSLTIISLTFGLLRGHDRPITAPFVAHLTLWLIWGSA